MPAALLIAFNFVGFLKGLLMFFFILSAILLTTVVLLQEPKGGGLSSAFGGMGAETFGVQTGGVNKFTSYVAAAFIGIAILYAAIPEGGPLSNKSLRDEVEKTAPSEPQAPSGAESKPAQGTSKPAEGGAGGRK